jgi:hypothetical protein
MGPALKLRLGRGAASAGHVLVFCTAGKKQVAFNANTLRPGRGGARARTKLSTHFSHFAAFVLSNCRANHFGPV